MRKKIAHHMIESRRISAHVHAMFEVDMTRIVNYRAKIRKEWEARNSAKLTFMPFFARAVTDLCGRGEDPSPRPKPRFRDTFTTDRRGDL